MDYDFLSGLKFTDKITPIVTLVVYYGKAKWIAPKDLHGMMELPANLQAFVPNYQMNLLEVRNSGKLIFHNQDVNMAF